MSEPFDITIPWVTAQAGSRLAAHVGGQLPARVTLVVHRLQALLDPDPGCPVHGLTPVRVLELADGELREPVSTTQVLNLHMPAQLSLVLLPATTQGSASAWLNAGADRCLSLDSDERLILAMVRSMLRRAQGRTAAVSVHGTLKFDHDSRTLYRGDQRIGLTLRETQIANLLFQGGPQLVKADQILRALGMRSLSARHSGMVSLYVHRVNRKIRRFGVHIEFVRNYGYRLSVDPWAELTLRSPPWLAVLPGGALSALARMPGFQQPDGTGMSDP